MTFFSNQTTLANWGLYQVGGQATRYPELKAQIGSIVANRVQALPWIPPNFQEQYNYFQYHQEQDNGGLIRFSHATGSRGQINADNPAFLDTPEKRAAWDAIAQTLDNATVNFVNEQRVIGAQQLQQLEDNADFWDGIAAGAQALGEGGGKLLGGAAEGVKNGLTILIVLAAIAGVGYLYVTNPSFRRVLGGK